MNDALAQHIARLLYDHECVIVPSFGAFLSRFHSAEINAATNMLRPPSRRIYFNPGLKENDGLLAKSISLTESCTYKDALASINNNVNSWQNQLARGEKLIIAGVGRLYFDDKNKLQFTPSLEINYQRSSYGLSIFRTPAVDRELKIRQTIQKTIEKHVPAAEVHRKSRRIPWAAVLVPVIFAGIVGAAYVGWQQEPMQQLSGLNFLEWSKSSPEVTEDVAEEVADTPEMDPVVEETMTESEAANEEMDEIPVARLYPYHIIVGSFKEAANAERYVADLRAKGYDAYKAQGDNRFQRVAIGNFATREQADDALRGIRLNLNSQAWVYTN